MDLDVEYFEYECGTACTLDGCCGHATDIPVGICLDGEWFWVDGYDGGDYPGKDDAARIEKIKGIVSRLLVQLA